MKKVMVLLLLGVPATAEDTRYHVGVAECLQGSLESPAERAAAERKHAEQELRAPRPDTGGDVFRFIAIPSPTAMGVDTFASINRSLDPDVAAVHAAGFRVRHETCLAQDGPIGRVVLMSGERRLEAALVRDQPLEYQNAFGAKRVLHGVAADFPGPAFRAFVAGASFEIAIVRPGHDLVKMGVRTEAEQAAVLARIEAERAAEMAVRSCSLTAERPVYHGGGSVTVQWLSSWESAGTTSGTLDTPENEFRQQCSVYRGVATMAFYSPSKAPRTVSATLRVGDCVATASVQLPKK